MTQRTLTEFESGAGHSLVGVATNVLGLLILVATLAGYGASRFVPDNEQVDLAATRQAAQALEGDVNRLADEVEKVRAEASLRKFERDQLALALAAADHDLAGRRAALDGEARKKFDRDRALSAAAPTWTGWARSGPPRWKLRTRRSRSRTIPRR